ncbi:MAG: FUSC family protein [Gordonia sp. (in: high G+C Gram-positive bacteria)]
MARFRWAGLHGVLHGTEVAARTAALAGAGLVILAMCDRIDLAAYTMFGAFCAAYGGNEQYRTRARTVAVAGLVNLSAMVAGIGLALVEATSAARLVAFALLIAVAVVAAYRYELVPAQPFFPVISLLVCAVIPVSGWTDAAARIGIATLATVGSWGLSMSGWLVRRLLRHRPGGMRPSPGGPAISDSADAQRRLLLKDLNGVTRVRPLGPARDAIAMTVGLIVGAGVISELIVQALGLPRSYWALVTCASVMPMVGGAVSSKKAVERVIGTAVGVLLLTMAPALPLPVTIGIIAIVVSQFFTQLLVAAFYAEALVFITVLVFVSLSYSMPLSDTDLLARLADTAVGSAVSLVLLAVVSRIVPRVTEPGGLIRRDDADRCIANRELDKLD